MNQMNNISEFIKVWDTEDILSENKSHLINLSKLGNINLLGDVLSDRSALFTKKDKNFFHSIEPGVLGLVETLVNKFNWITYSSCEGHVSYNGKAYKKRTIQILPRSSSEKQIILSVLDRAKKFYDSNREFNDNNIININITEEEIFSVDESKNYIGVRIKFENSSGSEIKYFENLNAETINFTKFLEMQINTKLDDKKIKLAPKTVVVILKVIETCNINCTYCYFFNGIDDSYTLHPGKISLDTIQNIADYFRQACLENEIKILRIDFHGGEPLLAKPKFLSKVCDIFIKELGEITTLQFTLQTNAMLINEEWIDIFNKYTINIGISIDGPKEYHDKYRVDHQGKGTYDQTKLKIDLLRKYYQEKKINFGIGVLSVINPEFSAKKLYRHLVDDLKFNSIDFLLPDNTWDSTKKENFSSESYGTFLCDLFDEWIKDNNPKIYIRIFDTIISQLLKTSTHYHDFGGWLNDFLLVTISSDGQLSPDDTYRSANPKLMNTGLSVRNSVFDDFLNHPSVLSLYEASYQLPKACEGCLWQNTCKGGSLLHRYSELEGFANHSVYCEALKMIYEKVSNFLTTLNER